MWLVARYASTTLFSLKPALATSSGGTSLLAPTPYALKMGLLDVAYRTVGVCEAERLWPSLRDLKIGYRPPQFATITKLFARILKRSRSQPEPGGPPAGPFASTIGYREYVHFSEPLSLALALEQDSPKTETLVWLLSGLSYLGKRGGLVQLVEPPQLLDELPRGFVPLNSPQGQTSFDARGILQLLDDCGPEMTAMQANVYRGERIRVGKERLSRPIVLPYRVVRSGKSYTLYQRLD